VSKQYTQEDVNKLFNYALNHDELEYSDDCERIQKAIKTHRGFSISIPEAARFWKTRSSWWDASWLILPKKDDEIVEYWDKFLADWYTIED
jgi:hypothetical protein